MRNTVFFNSGFFHVYNRGVDGRDIFFDNADRWRFLNSITKINSIGLRSVNKIGGEFFGMNADQPYVKIHAFTLMPNHYHFILEQLVENGISIFMGRLSNSFTKYFNYRYERSGRLFENPFQAIQVNDERYLTHLMRYIHLNPLSIYKPNWKSDGIDDWKDANAFLMHYPWSSYSDYLATQKFSFLTTEFLSAHFDNSAELKKFHHEYATKEILPIDHLLFD
jgi:putative transposase